MPSAVLGRQREFVRVQADLDVKRVSRTIEAVQGYLQIQFCPFHGTADSGVERGFIFFGPGGRVGKREIAFAVAERQTLFFHMNFQFMKLAVPPAVSRIKAKRVSVLAVRNGPLHGSFDVVSVVRSSSSGAGGENDHGVEIPLIRSQGSAQRSGIERAALGAA